jgi:hypothetical protein
MRTRQLLPAAAGILALGLPASFALGAAGTGPSPARAATAAPAISPAGVVASERALQRIARVVDQRARVARVARLSVRRSRLAGVPQRPRSARRVLAGYSPRALRRHERRLRARIAELRRTGGAPDVPIPAALDAIAQCESGGNPSAVSANGLYRGLFQFDRGTWASVGGSGDPAAAPREEQYRRAAMLYARAGAAPWPVCGR